MKLLNTFLMYVLVLLLASCMVPKQNLTSILKPVDSLKYLGDATLPEEFIYKSTTVGGLSGIDYDPLKDDYYLISDDRSAFNPARFYTAKISISEKGIAAIRFKNTYQLPQRLHEVPDAESIRYNPLTRRLVWSSEGERTVKPGDTVLIQPLIQYMTTKGKALQSFTLPPSLRMQAIEKGPQKNLVVEGLAFTANYESIYACMEGSLYEDLAADKSLVRLLKFDAASGLQTKEYAYETERGYGVSEILSLSPSTLLFIERFWIEGKGFFIKVYVGDLSSAENIMGRTSLASGKIKLIHKKLLLDFSRLNKYIDNIEGVTFGPKLPNGHQTLLFVSDNNFSKDQKTQLLLFELL